MSFLGHSDRWNHWVPFSIRSYYPGYGFSLKRKDSSDVIGSQDELLFAYQDMKEEDQGVLYLDLFLEKGKKRSLSEYISDEDVCFAFLIFHIAVERGRIPAFRRVARFRNCIVCQRSSSAWLGKVDSNIE